VNAAAKAAGMVVPHLNQRLRPLRQDNGERFHYDYFEASKKRTNPPVVSNGAKFCGCDEHVQQRKTCPCYACSRFRGETLPRASSSAAAAARTPADSADVLLRCAAAHHLALPQSRAIVELSTLVRASKFYAAQDFARTFNLQLDAMLRDTEAWLRGVGGAAPTAVPVAVSSASAASAAAVLPAVVVSATAPVAPSVSDTVSLGGMRAMATSLWQGVQGAFGGITGVLGGGPAAVEDAAKPKTSYITVTGGMKRRRSGGGRDVEVVCDCGGVEQWRAKLKANGRMRGGKPIHSPACAKGMALAKLMRDREAKKEGGGTQSALSFKYVRTYVRVRIVLYIRRGIQSVRRGPIKLIN